MGIMARIKFLLRMKTALALNNAENPLQVFDYALEQQQELLGKVRQGLIEVSTSKHQLESQFNQLKVQTLQVKDQARRALLAGREDLTRQSLQHQQVIGYKLEDLKQQLAEVVVQEEQLIKAERQLNERIEDFQERRRVLSARHSAAEAQVRVNQALAGVAGEYAELAITIGRAEEKTEQMQSRAIALNDFIERSLPSFSKAGDVVERELRILATEQNLEAQLAELKAQLNQGKTLPSLPEGTCEQTTEP